MLDTLDRQMQIKEEEKKFQKMHELHVDNLNMQYQFEQFDKRNQRNKKFGQNPRVYDYYQKIDHERALR